MKNTLITCAICKDIFRNRNDMNNHVRRYHQSMVKIKFQNGDVIEVKREADNKFKCTCGKSFELPWPLQRHAKGCNNKLTELEEIEEEVELMNVDDSDASESMNMSNKIIPADCFGALISH